MCIRDSVTIVPHRTAWTHSRAHNAGDRPGFIRNGRRNRRISCVVPARSAHPTGPRDPHRATYSRPMLADMSTTLTEALAGLAALELSLIHI